MKTDLLDLYVVEKFGERVGKIHFQSVLNKNQQRIEKYEDKKFKATLYMRFDDSCGNGHNTFSMTWMSKEYYQGLWQDWSCGAITYADAKKYFPKFAKYHRWHLCSTISPLHYLENTAYWVRAEKLDVARETAVWPNATLEDLSSKSKLKARLPDLLELFRADMSDLKFVW
jgi:hypothetical protein